MMPSIKGGVRRQKEKIFIAVFSPNEMQRGSGCAATWHDNSLRFESSAR
jgi:hypothetical protein